ncbi:MAG TPA: hypothetical protein PKX93_11770, partial [bacterium]|nr:hypothetical protein [bacterium]
VEGQSLFWLVEDRTGRYRPVSDKMQKVDGHCSYNQAETLILNDTYPINGYRELNLFDPVREKTLVLGRYLSLPVPKHELRCDLHPRWSRDEKQVSFDSIHEGYRRVYVLSLPELR